MLDDDSFRRLQVLLEGAAGLVFDDARRDSLGCSNLTTMLAFEVNIKLQNLRGRRPDVVVSDTCDQPTG